MPDADPDRDASADHDSDSSADPDRDARADRDASADHDSDSCADHDSDASAGRDSDTGADPRATTTRSAADGSSDTATSTPPLVDQPVEDPTDIDLTDPRLYCNRELSELQFQRRVLNEALDERTPLLDRVRFLSIFTRNMDEFFMKRVGGLKQQLAAGVLERSPDGMTPHEQWTSVIDRSRELFALQRQAYHETIQPALADAGIHVRAYDDLAADEQAALDDYFETDVLPTLTPLSVDPDRSFPFVSNLSLSLAVLTRDADGETTFSRVKIPGNRPRLVCVETRLPETDDPSGTDSRQFVPLEQVVAANLDALFPNVEVVDSATFRVTRNAEVRRNEDVAEGLIQTIEGVIRDRRFATVVRLEVGSDMPDRAREVLVENLALDEREVFDLTPPLDFRDLDRLADLDRPDLRRTPWTPRAHPRLRDEGRSVFETVSESDLLLHHPYHSFDDTVQRFLDEAARDPDVLAIKAAIYRTAQDSRVIESLIEAAQNGKQVAVMVELKARFDEENNLRWVKRLEEEGIHVAYGTLGTKAHSKVALVVRDEPDGVTLYSHVGTGNYHAGTAKQYVDLGLLTADQDVGQDLTSVFNAFTGHGSPDAYRRLLVAPTTMRDRFVELLRREADHAREGRAAGIVAKLNSLEDPAMVRELYRASQAGVDIDLLVRGICRLRPGIEGVSDTIDVVSVVGRFLEHSRLFRFENDGDPDFFVGSADWMTRNLDRRIEVVTPVADESHRAELQTVLDMYRADNRLAWDMQSDGSYVQRRPGPDEDVRNVQQRLMARAASGDGPLGTDRVSGSLDGTWDRND